MKTTTQQLVKSTNSQTRSSKILIPAGKLANNSRYKWPMFQSGWSQLSIFHQPETLRTKLSDSSDGCLTMQLNRFKPVKDVSEKCICIKNPQTWPASATP